MKVPKDLRKLLKAARQQGWTVELRRCNHTMWKPPRGPALFHSGTTSDIRANKNFEHQLKRAGLKLPQ